MHSHSPERPRKGTDSAPFVSSASATATPFRPAPPHPVRGAGLTATSRPFRVHPGPASLLSPSLLERWHLLSLDAPTVAAVWTGFLAWCAGVHLPSSDLVAMFLAVWILYAADRLLDARPFFAAPLGPELRARHRFHHRHRAGFLTAIVALCVPLLLLLHNTADTVLRLHVLLAVLLGAWLLLVHGRSEVSGEAHPLPKELAVGLFFAAAVCIPTIGRAPAVRPALLPAAVLFAFLCSLNCLFLYAWEHPHGHAQGHRTTLWAVRHLSQLAIACLGLSLGLGLEDLALRTVIHPERPAALPHAGALSVAFSLASALLLLLHARRTTLPELTARALADLVLLTPLPVLLACSLLHPRP